MLGRAIGMHWHALVHDVLRLGYRASDILTTLRNVLLSAVLSSVLGFVLGAIIHALPRVRGAIEPLLASYYAIPTFMFYPIFIGGKAKAWEE